jgi:hypothetical protein
MKWLEFTLKVLIVCVITTLWLLFATLACKNKAIEFIRHRTVSWKEQERIVRQELFCQLVRDYIRMGKDQYGRGRYEQALENLRVVRSNVCGLCWVLPGPCGLRINDLQFRDRFELFSSDFTFTCDFKGS